MTPYFQRIKKTHGLVPTALPIVILQISYPQELHVTCLSLHKHNWKEIQLHALLISKSSWLVKKIFIALLYHISLQFLWAIRLQFKWVADKSWISLCCQHCGEAGFLVLMFVCICKWRYSLTLALTADIFTVVNKSLPQSCTSNDSSRL